MRKEPVDQTVTNLLDSLTVPGDGRTSVAADQIAEHH